MNRYTILLPYFGEDKRFFDLLCRTIYQLRQVGTRHSIAILTDKGANHNLEALADTDNVQVVRVDTAHYRDRYTRANHPGWAFDYKSCLIMSALDRPTQSIGRDQRAIVMDIDNMVLKNFDEVVDTLPPAQMGIADGPDRGEDSQIPANAITGKPLLEMTSAFMVFPLDARWHMIRYRSLWDRAAGAERDHVLLEQRTWSLVWHTSPALARLPRTMSWSRIWGMPPPADVLLHHQHGDEKWRSLAGQ